MGQVLAVREIQDGVRLYNDCQCEAAIRKWKRCLPKVRRGSARFLVLGHLASAHGDLGRHRDMLAYSTMQIELANEVESSGSRAEAYLNLARSNERLGEYHKAVSYGRHCLQAQPGDLRIHGQVYLTQGTAYLGLSSFSRGLEMLEYALRVAQQCGDRTLELQVYSVLGTVFWMFKDYEKALTFHVKAYQLAQFAQRDGGKHHRQTCLNLAIAYGKLGEDDQAREYCKVSTQ